MKEKNKQRKRKGGGAKDQPSDQGRMAVLI
jgi:hypothetical protein